MPSTRRRALRSAAGLLALLAGCSAETSVSSTERVGGTPPADAITDPPRVALRRDDPAPIVTKGDGASDTDTPRERFWRHEVVADADTADSLAFADVDGADDARAFLEDTDYDEETVFVEQRAIQECYDLSLCWVRWSADRIETDYGRRLLPADVACEADAYDATARLIRLPVALDPDEIHEYGSSVGGGGCDGSGSAAGSAGEGNA